MVEVLFGSCRLREWLEDVLWEGGTGLGEVYRMKGVVAVQGSHRLHIVQAVRELYDITEGPVMPEGDCAHTRLVLIGKGLETAELQSSFWSSMQACRESQPSTAPATP